MMSKRIFFTLMLSAFTLNSLHAMMLTQSESKAVQEAFAHRVRACCELDEDQAQLDLFRSLLIKYPHLCRNVDKAAFHTNAGMPFGNYFEKMLSEERTHARTQQFIDEWKKCSMQALVDFVDHGNAADFIAAHGDDSLKAVQAFVTLFLSKEDVGAYINAAGETVLAKFVECVDERAVAIIKYLTDECGATPDAGPVGNTARDRAVKKGNQAVVDLLDQASYRRYLRRWIKGEESAMPLIHFFADHPSTRIQIHKTPSLMRNESCENILWQMRCEGTLLFSGVPTNQVKQLEAMRILAHAAPHIKGKDNRMALTTAIVACCELSEEDAPLQLLISVIENIRATKPSLRMGPNSRVFAHYAGARMNEYLLARLADPHTKERTELVCTELKKFYHFHPDSDLVRPQVLWITHPADGNVLSITMLVRDCILEEARMDELTQYLLSLDVKPFIMPDLSHFEGMKWADKQRALIVTKLIAQHNNIDVPCRLFSKLLDAKDADQQVREFAIQAFTSYICEHQLDIDVIPWRDGIIMGTYADCNAPAVLEPAYRSVEQYRSEPEDGDTLYKKIKRVLAGEEAIDVLREFLQGRRFNIDRVLCSGDYNQLVTIASQLEKDPRSQTILELPEIKNFRLPAGK